MIDTHVVTIGGGGGHSAVIAALMDHISQITAVCNTVDDGGSSGRLRRERGVFPPGDIRQVLSTLAGDRGNALAHRYHDGVHAGHTKGNLLLADLEEKTGAIQSAIHRIREAYSLVHEVVPLTDIPGVLHAETQSGKIITSQYGIVEHIWGSPDDAITSLALFPTHIHLSAGAQAALLNADSIIIPMGDLYGSVGPVFCLEDMTRILETSKATIIWLPNAVAPIGHTQYRSVGAALQFFQTLQPHFVPHYIVTHDGTFTPEESTFLQENGYRVVSPAASIMNTTIVSKDLLDHTVQRTTQRGDLIRRSPIHYNKETLTHTLLSCITHSV